MNKLFTILFISFLTLISCSSKKENSITKVEILEKEFNFGNISINDTIIQSFKIKNLTNTELKINNLATSCGCTTIGKIDSFANKNETIEMKLRFIPKKEQVGNEVTNSVVVEMNTEPSFIVFRLKGIVSEELSN